jgi:hypothetical protein
MMDFEERIIEESEHLYQKIRDQTENELNEKYNNPDSLQSSSQTSSFSIFQSSHKKVNFVRGNTSLKSIQKVLFQLLQNDYVNKAETAEITSWNFIDLGCGDGECVSAAFLFDHFFRKSDHTDSPLVQFTSIIGVDLQKQQLESARYLIRNLKKELQSNSSSSAMFPQVILMEEDFLHIDWSQLLSSLSPNPSLVYICATCFTQELIEAIVERIFPVLLPGSIVICLDKELSLYCRSSSSELTELHVQSSSPDKPPLEFLFSQSCVTSWGEGTAFVYRKK